MANWFSELFGNKKNQDEQLTPSWNQVPSWYQKPVPPDLNLWQMQERIKNPPPEKDYNYNTDYLDQWAHPNAQWAMTRDPRVNPAFVEIYPNSTPFNLDYLDPEQRVAYQKNVKAISSNPLAILGADPSKTNITSNNEGSLGGVFYDETGEIYLGPSMRSQVHESMHSGLKKLRDLGDVSDFERYVEKPADKPKGIRTLEDDRALNSYIRNKNVQSEKEELLVRYLMQKRNGNDIYDDPEKDFRPQEYTDSLNDPKVRNVLKDTKRQVMDAADRRYRIQQDLIAQGTSHPWIAPGEPPVTAVKPKMLPRSMQDSMMSRSMMDSIRRGRPIMDSRQDK